jgi:hypothetical protein
MLGDFIQHVKTYVNLPQVYVMLGDFINPLTLHIPKGDNPLTLHIPEGENPLTLHIPEGDLHKF